MSLPGYEEMDDPLLCFILLNESEEGGVHAFMVYEPLAEFFDLTARERTIPRPDGRGGTLWQNRVQWARQRLINRGYIDGRERGIWKLTELGRRRAASVARFYSGLKTRRDGID